MPDSAALPDPPAGVAVRTTCPYCGVGCGVVARPDGAGGASIAGDLAHPANGGRLCSKGSALGETLSLDGRLLHPQIDGVRVSWDAALDAVARGLAETVARHGPDSVAFYVSGQLLTEDYYAVNKLAKGFLGTANIDTNSRLCMASSVAGHRRAFGGDVVPGLYEDLEQADLVVLVGSNLAWCHPILFQRLAAARETRGRPRVVVVDPRRTETCDIADLHLALRPGSDVALFNGLLAELARRGRIDRRYVARHTTGVEDALLAARAGAPDAAATAAACGLPPAEVETLFDWVAATERTVTVYSQGVNQSTAGVDKVNAIINCHLLTGRIGRPGMGPFSVTGQPNAMGGREVGALANQLAAHMDFAPRDIDRLARFWRAARMARRPGLKAVELFEAVRRGEVKALWIMATNPVVSLPDADAVRAALQHCPLSIVSEAVRDSDTVEACRIRLPALAWGEKEGTVTNSERRISRQRAFLPPPGEARADWWAIAQVARRLGFGAAFDWRGPADIFREHAGLSAFENDGSRAFDIGAYAGLDDEEYDALEPFLWPAPAGNRAGEAAAPRFFVGGRYFHSDRLARFVPVGAREPANAPDARHPLRLNTGRLRDQWHTMTRTGRSARLALHRPEPTLDMHPDDAAAHGLGDGDLAELSSRWGTARLRVRLSGELRPGEVFAPMHWTAQFAARGRINAVTNPAVDAISGQPELKHTPVAVARWPARWQGFVLARERLDLSGIEHWTAARGEGCWIYDLAGKEAASQAWETLSARLRQAGDDWLEYADPAHGRHRGALLRADRLAGLVHLAPDRDLAARAWLAGLFAARTIAPAQRLSLLAGRPESPVADEGPVICACFGVCRDPILKAIAAGADSVEEIGAVSRAGTNCGSCRPELRGLLRQAAPLAGARLAEG